MNNATVLLRLSPSNNPHALSRLNIEDVQFSWVRDGLTDQVFATFSSPYTISPEGAQDRGEAIARAIGLTLDIGVNSVQVHRIANAGSNTTITVQSAAHVVRDDLSTQDIQRLSQIANQIVLNDAVAKYAKMLELYRKSLSSDNTYSQFWLLYAILQIKAATILERKSERRKVDHIIRQSYSTYVITRDATPGKRAETISKVTAVRDLFSHTDGVYGGQTLTVDDLIDDALPKLRDVAKRLIMEKISHS